MTSFFSYFFGIIFRPLTLFKRLMQDKHPFRKGFLAVLGTGGWIMLTSGLLAVAGGVPMAPLTWPFQPDNYYVWQALFVLPALVVVWFLISGVIHFLGRGGRKGGSPKKTLGLTGFAVSCSLFLAWIPQAVIAGFYTLGMGQQEMVDILSEPGPWQTLFLAFFVIAALVALILFSVAVFVSQKVKWWMVILTGILAEVLLAVPVLLFLR